VALFALAGVAGAVAAPIAGRVADRGWSRAGTVLAMLATSAAVLVTFLAQHGSTSALAILVAAAILIDAAVMANLVFGQRAIFLLSPDLRSRINGLYMATFFMGGAVGSAIGVWAYAGAGWPGVVWIGAALPLLALAYFMTGRRH
jgi:predicted MFS family arabinose efflux permease